MSYDYDLWNFNRLWLHEDQRQTPAEMLVAPLFTLCQADRHDSTSPPQMSLLADHDVAEERADLTKWAFRSSTFRKIDQSTPEQPVDNLSPEGDQ